MVTAPNKRWIKFSLLAFLCIPLGSSLSADPEDALLSEENPIERIQQETFDSLNETEQKLPPEELEEQPEIDLLSAYDIEPATENIEAQEVEPALLKEEDVLLQDEPELDDEEITVQEQEEVILPKRQKKIRNIIISGNSMVPDSVVLSRVPFRPGELFDPTKTRTLIRNLYYDLKRFRNITVMGENAPDNQIDLHIMIEEKKKLKGVEFEGNNKVTEKEINKKIDFCNIPAIDQEELSVYAHQIKQLYLEKNFHAVEIEPELKIDDDGQAIAIFEIKEGKKSLVKRVQFVGNDSICGKELRRYIFTREDWPLSFWDGSGSYQPARIEGDKHMLEQFYQNRGFMMAKVVDVDVHQDPKTKHFDITFEIQEGEPYTFGEVSASGEDILKDEFIITRLPVQPGDLYSRERIVDSIKALEGLWGELGYIYAHVDPSIQPDPETKTVNVSFHTDLGNRIFLNKINIIGNKKTCDKVIRRKLLLSEGQLLTESRMEASKFRVEGLGFFDQKDGVIWRKVRVNDECADLDLILKEVKTGSANFKIGFGGSGTNMNSPASGFTIGADIADTNLMGTGIALNLSASWAKEEQSIVFNITDPWLFDKPILGALDIYHRRPVYDDFKYTRPVGEQLTGGGATLGFMTPWALCQDAQMHLRVGADRICYGHQPIANVIGVDNRVKADAEYQCVLDKLFKPGKFFWLEAMIGADQRNHPMLTSRGYRWNASARAGFPTFGCNIGFYRFDIEGHWYTPLIGEQDLILHLRGFAGFLSEFKGRTIPYREEFHIGGPATVRGFLFGQAGPQFLCDSIGGSKAMVASAELVFPITPDFSTKGVVFYDAGCGWDSPYACCVSSDYLRHNKFNFRHSVGVGIRILRPMPIRIDWGFKLNPNKKCGESKSEVHFGMTYDF